MVATDKEPIKSGIVDWMPDSPTSPSRYGRALRPAVVAGVGILGLVLVAGRNRRFEGPTYDALKDPSRWEYAQTHYKPPRTWGQDKAKRYTSKFARDWHTRYPEYPILLMRRDGVPQRSQDLHRGWKMAHRQSPPLTHTVKDKQTRLKYKDILLAREVDNIRESGKTPSMMDFAQNPYFNPTTPRRRQEERTGVATGGRGRKRRANFNWKAAFEYMYPNLTYDSKLWDTFTKKIWDASKHPEEIGDPNWLNLLLFQANILDLYGAQQGKCALTGLSFNLNQPYATPSMDRIIPRYQGGFYEPNNVRLVLQNINLGLKDWEDEAIAYMKPNGLSSINLETFILPDGEEKTLLIPSLEQRKLYVEHYGFIYKGGATPPNYQPPSRLSRRGHGWRKYLEANYPQANYSLALMRRITNLVDKKTNPSTIASRQKWWKETKNRTPKAPTVCQEWKDNPADMRDFILDLYGKQNGECAVTGLPFTSAHEVISDTERGKDAYTVYPRNQSYAVPSLDQIIPSDVEGSPGYAPGNVRLVLLVVNRTLRNYRDSSMAYLHCNGLGENNLKRFTTPNKEELTLMIPSQRQEDIYTDPKGSYQFVEVTS